MVKLYNFILILCISFYCIGLYTPKNETLLISNVENAVVKQNGDYWCWAASIESVLKYNGIKLSQEEIIQRVYGIKTIGDEEKRSKAIELPHQHVPSVYHRFLQQNGISLSYISLKDIFDEIQDENIVLVWSPTHISLIVGYEIKDGKAFYAYMDTGRRNAPIERISVSELMKNNPTFIRAKTIKWKQ